ncbi:MAG TPA: phosphosulfolactate synthase [Flavobacteriales bacterium]|nr:phosphosulfolactate synthase [Salibacteraceae bacterium]HAS35246.1 phosphosulfolactate synthase [Flavobacteriales bacterium]
MNYDLDHIPERTVKPRKSGINMIMDKGLSMAETENMVARSEHLIDYVKFGFGTSYATINLEEKLAFYKENNIRTYFGGTLFEAFFVRGQYEDYKRLLDKFDMPVVEVSDGSCEIPEDKKCEMIADMAKDRIVLSEVGSKEEGIFISPATWINMMNNELSAGSELVIAEARESGNVGIYRPNGSAHTLLINKILSNVPGERILWEAPIKSQQVWFIKLLGANVNLGNIGPHDVIPLETLRLGLRGDTFFEFLPEDIVNEFKP